MADPVEQPAVLPEREGHGLAFRLLLVAVLGAGVGVVTWAFIRGVHELQHLLWVSLPGAVPLLDDNPWLTTITLCTVGGVLVGLLHVHKPLPTGLAESLAEIEDEPGTISGPPGSPAGAVAATTPLMPATLVALASLTFGASLGPEAPVVVIVVGLVKRIGRVLSESGLQRVSVAAALGAVFLGPLGSAALVEETDPDAPGASSRGERMATVLVGALAGALSFRVLPSSGGIEPYTFPDLGPSTGPGPYAWAIAAGLLGALIGLGVRWTNPRVAGVMAARMPSVLVRATVAGLVMGLMGAVAPLVMFNGMHQTQQLLDNLAGYSALTLAALAVWKVLATAVVLGGRFMGGEVFPAIFSGIALALALTPLGAPVGVVAAAGAAGACAASLGRPIVAVLLLMLFFRAELVIALAVGAVVAAVLAAILEHARGTGAQEPAVISS